MFYRNRNNLFSQGDIDATLRAHAGRLEQGIKNLTLSEISNKEESELVRELVEKYKVSVPSLREAEKEIDAQEGEVEVYNQFRFHDEPRTVRRSGLKIAVRIPFDGDSQLFHCRASTYSLSGTPEGVIEGRNLILNYETAEKDADKIKEMWGGDIRDINQNLSWLAKDINTFNSSLENKIKTLVANRKAQAEGNKSLIDKLKS